MSLRKSDHLGHCLGLRWKEFVKESCYSHEKHTEPPVHELRFRENEAKIAYEEIINQDNTNFLLKQNKHLKSNNTTGQNTLIVNKCNVQTELKSKQVSSDIAKINVNTILKAVEQRDLKFLQKYVNLDNVNLTDEFGWTPLMSAAYCGYLEIVQLLLNLGANKRAREKSGLTAAQLALKKNYLSIVALLKKKLEFSNDNNQSTSSTSNSYFDNILTVRPDVREVLKDCKEGVHNDVTNLNDHLNQNIEFYCETCKANFRETTVKKHESSTLHIFNTKPKLPSAMYGISKLNKGYQMLLNTGWDEENGLGPSGKGIKYPIKTVLKIDRKGLGQSMEKEARVTHYKAGDINAIRILKQKPLKKRDREKLINRDVRKERALRIALS